MKKSNIKPKGKLIKIKPPKRRINYNFVDYDKKREMNKLPKSKKYFTCYRCKITFEKMNNEEWNEDKAYEEFRTLYPEPKYDPVDVLCDYCNEEFKKWYSKLTEDEKKKMRNET